MRIRWSNRIAVVDGLLQSNNLKEARKQALEILRDFESDWMLSEDETQYLKLVVALEKIEDIVKGDFTNGEEARDN